MTITSGFYADDTDPTFGYEQEQYAESFGAITTDGVKPYGGRFVVTAVTPTPNMTVNVAPGIAWVNGQWIKSTATENRTVETAHASYTRIDTVAARNTKTSATHGEMTIVVIKGTAAASPVPPTLQYDTSVCEIPLYYITIPALSSAITSGMISDGRLNMDSAQLHYCFDGGGAALGAGLKGYIRIPWNCTIRGVAMMGVTSGTMAMAIKTGALASIASLTSIVASAPPTITTALYSSDFTLTGWTTALTQGNILEFSITSNDTITHIDIDLIVMR